MKRVLFALLGLLLAGAVIAATEVHEGQKFIFGPTGMPIMLFSPSDSLGQAWRQGGTTGSASMDDVDRDRDKTDAITMLSAVSLAAATSSSVTTFTPFTQSAQDGFKWINLIITGGSAGAPWSLVFLGSDDASTYAYLMDSPPSISGTRWLDGDTLKLRGHGPTPAGGILIPLATRSGYPITTDNLAVIARHDSSAAAAALVFTVEAQGRGY